MSSCIALGSRADNSNCHSAIIIKNFHVTVHIIEIFLIQDDLSPVGGEALIGARTWGKHSYRIDCHVHASPTSDSRGTCAPVGLLYLSSENSSLPRTTENQCCFLNHFWSKFKSELHTDSRHVIYST